MNIHVFENEDQAVAACGTADLYNVEWEGPGRYVVEMTLDSECQRLASVSTIAEYRRGIEREISLRQAILARLDAE